MRSGCSVDEAELSEVRICVDKAELSEVRL